MRRLMITLIFLVSAMSSFAINYDDARREAWFLTDKMAYELDLNSLQYDRVYQVNMDYFLSINRITDANGLYWQYRDADLRCILTSWQYSLYSQIEYFVYPIRWVRSDWYYPAYDYYRRGYYYFSRPQIVISYHGVGFSHRRASDRSPYFGFAPGGGRGMRTSYGANPHDGRPNGNHGRYGNNGYDRNRHDNGQHHDNMGGSRSFDNNNNNSGKGNDRNLGGGRNFDNNNAGGGKGNNGNMGRGDNRPGNGSANGSNNGRDGNGNSRNFNNNNSNSRSSNSAPANSNQNSNSGRRTFGR